MSWVEVFAVLVVSHLVGDYIFQTEWQALHKPGGLGADGQARGALAAHVATYLGAFVPALIWIWANVGLGVAVGAAALVALPHAIQDDGRLLTSYVRRFKHVPEESWPLVYMATDQSFHVLVLFGTALVVGQ